VINSLVNILGLLFRKQLMITVFFFHFGHLLSQSTFDSLKLKLPKHYFNTVISVDGYKNAKNNLVDTNKLLTKRLKNYTINQFNLSFYTPIYTHEDTNSKVHSNTHYLLTGNFMLVQPVFEGIPIHDIIRAGAGFRVIHNTGKKGVWFFDASPFIIKDVSYGSKGDARMASSAIYSHNFSNSFNLRVGVVKTFLFGNRNYLPYIGFRVGALDRLHFSFQFPRSMSLVWPASNSFNFSLYSRSQGGIYTFSNNNQVYYLKNDATFYFARREVNTGLRVDFKPTSRMLFYVAGGLSTRNTISFYSDNLNRTNRLGAYKTFFYKNELPTTFFANFGLTIKLGKAKSVYNNTNLIDAIDLNNQNAPGDDNSFNGNINLPSKASKNYNLKSIEDLIDINDF